MGCIDADGQITRSAELILLAMLHPATIQAAFEECGLPLFRVRSAVRELTNAGLLKKIADNLYQVTAKGIKRIEGHE